MLDEGGGVLGGLAIAGRYPSAMLNAMEEPFGLMARWGHARPAAIGAGEGAGRFSVMGFVRKKHSLTEEVGKQLERLERSVAAVPTCLPRRGFWSSARPRSASSSGGSRAEARTMLMNADHGAVDHLHIRFGAVDEHVQDSIPNANAPLSGEADVAGRVRAEAVRPVASGPWRHLASDGIRLVGSIWRVIGNSGSRGCRSVIADVLILA
jgi:hypothetical protein